jgi:hypothetical protein
MRHFTFPPLEHLRWSLDHKDPGVNNDWLPALLARSQSMISHLELSGLPENCGFIRDVLQEAPTVTSLRFEHPNSDILSFLVGPESSDMLVLPKLQNLDITDVHIDLDADTLLEILESRQAQSPAALQEVVLHNLSIKYTPTRMARLLRLCADGLAFRHTKTENGVIEYVLTCIFIPSLIATLY